MWQNQKDHRYLQTEGKESHQTGKERENNVKSKRGDMNI